MIFIIRCILSLFLLLFLGDAAFAQDLADPALSVIEDVSEAPVSSTVRLLAILTALTFVPAVLLAMTPFTRFIIVFSMLRQALGLQSSPPNQVLVALSLFMSLLILRPAIEDINETAFTPYVSGEMETFDALETALVPMRRFMLSNTRKADLATMIDIGRLDKPETVEELPTPIVVASFMLSELKTAFVIGVKVYLPFLVIDIIIANILLGMGMLVLPPVIISLPFKIMLFVLMDGWTLLLTSMTASFYGL